MENTEAKKLLTKLAESTDSDMYAALEECYRAAEGALLAQFAGQMVDVEPRWSRALGLKIEKLKPCTIELISARANQLGGRNKHADAAAREVVAAFEKEINSIYEEYLENQYSLQILEAIDELGDVIAGYQLGDPNGVTAKRIIEIGEKLKNA